MKATEFELTADKKSVNFSDGGHLHNWQIQSICINRSDEEIREYLLEQGEKNGWYEDAIEDFIKFKNSELINEMEF